MRYEKALDVSDPIRGERFIRYDGPTYQVGVTLYNNGFVQLNIYLRSDAPEFSPNLFIEEDRDYFPKGVTIKTSSYGSLRVEDAKSFCRQMEEAVSSAEFIQKGFIQPLCKGVRDFGDAVTA